jgi:hypothetical protein
LAEITRNIIIPEFKAGSYYNGLVGTDAFLMFGGNTRRTVKIKKKISYCSYIVIIVSYASLLAVPEIGEQVGCGWRGGSGRLVKTRVELKSCNCSFFSFLNSTLRWLLLFKGNTSVKN